VRIEYAASVDEQQIRHVMEEWRRLTTEGGVDGLMSLATDDVVFLTPGNPPITKNDFANGFRQKSTKVRIESTKEVREIQTSGDIAYAWSHISVVLIPKEPGGKKWDGKWLLARDANLMAGAGNPDRV
jgi:uncharacterized protein (TIGR02246 family)